MGYSSLVLAIVISGCGGDGSGGSPPTPSNNQMLSEFFRLFQILSFN
tara:strand:+ start:311 stop:451 length:141 start_codon:yes stop_codon:yes gene_type:complete